MELPSDLSSEYQPNDLNQLISQPVSNSAKTQLKQPQIISPPESQFLVEKDDFSDLNRQAVSTGILSNASNVVCQDIGQTAQLTRNPESVLGDQFPFLADQPKQSNSATSELPPAHPPAQRQTASPEDDIFVQPLQAVQPATQEAAESQPEAAVPSVVEKDSISPVQSATPAKSQDSAKPKVESEDTVVHEHVQVAQRVTPVPIADPPPKAQKSGCCK